MIEPAAEVEAQDRSDQPPNATEIESRLLYAVLSRPSIMGDLTDLAPAEFYSQTHAVLFRAMLALWNRGVAIDGGTIQEILRSDDFAASGVNGRAILNLDPNGVGGNVESYARIIHDTATQRRYVDAAQSLAERAWRSGADVGQLAQYADGLLTAARPRRSRRNLLSPEEFARDLELDLEARATGKRTSVSTGLIDIDSMTGGLANGALYLTLAVPGSGKTEFAKQVAIHVGQKHGPVLFASLEMASYELAHRYARMQHGMDRNKLAKGQLSDEEWHTAARTIDELQRSNLWIASPGGRYTTADLRADALDVQTRSGSKVALVVADYLQLFGDGDNESAHRALNVGAIARGLKELARELGCPVLAPVQPNRAYASRMDKRPVMPDMRDSGELEQHADVVLGMYRPEIHDRDDTRPEDRGVLEMWMLKNRSAVGDDIGSLRRLRWTGTKYGNYAPGRPDYDLP